MKKIIFMLFTMTILMSAKSEKSDEHGKYQIPSSIKEEHEEIHEQLAKATKLKDKTGEAARKVAAALHPHFIREEEMAMPPLGLLADLSQGKSADSMQSVLAMTDKLKAELPQMLNEHKQIVGLLDELVKTAKAEGHQDVVEFGHKLKAHAEMEEQVLYPASILVGEYIKLKTKAK